MLSHGLILKYDKMLYSYYVPDFLLVLTKTLADKYQPLHFMTKFTGAEKKLSMNTDHQTSKW